MRQWQPIALFVLTLSLGPLALAASPTQPTNNFALRLLKTMEYIDYPDMLVAVAAGNSQPWLRYENGEKYVGRNTPLEDRWTRATSLPIQAKITDELISLYRTFTENPAGDFRGTPIDFAGGDLEKDSYGNGYDRLTARQNAVILANPFLSVESQPDPASTVGARLVRYRYPSAGTFHKFAAFLSPSLRQDLLAAEANGLLKYDQHDLTTVKPEFKALNRRIIRELLTKVYDPAKPTLINYQRMIAVHPFDDYNGRSLRAWYRTTAHFPLFLQEFYCDLYCSVSEFSAQVETGKKQYAQLMTGLAYEESLHPQESHFYDIDTWWLVAAQLHASPGGNAWKFVQESKHWFLVPEAAQKIDHKLFHEVLADFEQFARSGQ